MKRAMELALQSDNPSAAVAALRLGADVMGMLGGGKAELPDGLDQALKAIGFGYARGQQSLPDTG